MTIKEDLNFFFSGNHIIKKISRFIQTTAKKPKRLMSDVIFVIGMIPLNPKMLSIRSYMKNRKDTDITNGKSE